jgi:hypothetical protein
MSEKEPILEGLRPLIEQAELGGKWLHCNYQDIWFSPKELREQNANGHFIWGAVNWEIRDPNEQVSYLEGQVESAKRAVAAFKQRLGQAG